MGKTKFKMIYLKLRIEVVIILINFVMSTHSTKEEIKSRQKRILWVTQDGRLALPPGTTLVISPSLSMPFVRYPPDGFFSNLTISLPFTIDFNKLGLTDNENPYGVVPPILARSMGRAAGGILADYIGHILERRRHKRSTVELPPKPHVNAFHGGERALLYIAVEELLENFGMNGKACMLRAICEVHAHPMKNFGLLGEMLKLFFSASKSPYAEMLPEYVEAENAGRGKLGGPAECWPYMKDCPKSLFAAKHNHYSGLDYQEFLRTTPPVNAFNFTENDDIEDNEILEKDSIEDNRLKNAKVTYNPTITNM